MNTHDDPNGWVQSLYGDTHTRTVPPVPTVSQIREQLVQDWMDANPPKSPIDQTTGEILWSNLPRAAQIQDSPILALDDIPEECFLIGLGDLIIVAYGVLVPLDDGEHAVIKGEE